MNRVNESKVKNKYGSKVGSLSRNAIRKFQSRLLASRS